VAKPLAIQQWVKGTTVSLEKGRGKNTYVVEFWATWCPPCRASIPHLTELAKKFKNKDVVFAGISDEDTSTVASFVEKQGDKMDYNVGVDDNRKTAEAYMKAFQINGIPHAFVVDKKGRVVWQGHPMAGLDEALEEIVAGKFDLEAAKKAQVAEALIRKYEIAVSRRGDKTEAKKMGEQVLTDSGRNWGGLNELSWFILTSRSIKDEDRDRDLAVRLAKKGCEASKIKNSMILDTYARALFDNGKAKDAIDIEKQALEHAESDREKKEIEETIKRYSEKK
jgi:thiol-disulfide isomerase/thioredoxin